MTLKGKAGYIDSASFLGLAVIFLFAATDSSQTMRKEEGLVCERGGSEFLWRVAREDGPA